MNSVFWIGTRNNQVRFRQVWILSIAFVVLATMGIGAMTRLTGSGLSIVEWKPLSGAIPPLNETEWSQEFLRYQEFPEFKSNPNVTLEDFKTIFWWEFTHRLIARSLIFVILIPFIFLVLKKEATGRDLRKLILLLLMGAVQGALGWYMVKSGLVQVPRVSHFRLMVHFIWASLIIAYLARWLREENTNPQCKQTSSERLFLRVLGGLCLGQMALGALVAGSRAGYIYNTFPKFGDTWWPQKFLIFPTLTENLLYNQINLQLFHRLGAWLMVIAAVYALIKRYYLIGSLIFLQFVLGILTLVLMVPPPVATLHQLCGVVLFFVLRYEEHPLSVVRGCPLPNATER
ncbi:MAG: COX15/CtaA family protein [Bdellovibrio sp.]|nr:COX15/CtaA family protein [Bdellovibrio sp.]